MAAPNISDLGQVIESRLVGVIYGQTVITTFHYEVVGTPVGFITPNEAAQQIADVIWDDTVAGGLFNCLSNSFGGARIDAQVISPVRYVATSFTPATTIGAVGSPAETQTVTVCVARHSLVAGRQNRGRFFIPAIPHSFCVGGALTAGGLATTQTAVARFANDIVLAGVSGTVTIRPVIFNLRAPTHLQPINNHTVDSTLRQQRRRELGRGI